MIDLLENVLEQHDNLFKSDSIEVAFDCPADDEEVSNFFIHGDARRLEQLLINLANNTRYYTQAPGKLSVSIHLKLDQIEVTWSDSSPGASDTDITRLFDRLFRIEASRNRNTGGSGLGLAICQNIVEAHQGHIEAKHSALGGISIVMTFPRRNN